jgi:hypothetical protein
MPKSGNESDSLKDGSLADDTSRRSHRLQLKRNKPSVEREPSDEDSPSLGIDSQVDERLDQDGYESTRSVSVAPPQETVHLTADHCRIQTTPKINGQKVLCICGVPFLACKRHINARNSAEEGKMTRFQPGVYAKAANRGKYPHGEAGGYFRYETATSDDLSGNGQLADTVQAGPSRPEEDEIQVLRRKVDQQLVDDQALPNGGLGIALPPVPVDILPPLPPMGQPLVPGTHAADPARLLQPFGGGFNLSRAPGTPATTRQGTPKPSTPSALRHPANPLAPARQQSPRPTTPPTIRPSHTPAASVDYYGMTTPEGNPVIIKGQSQALNSLRQWNWGIDQIFSSYQAAKVWEAQQIAKNATVPNRPRPSPAADATSTGGRKANRRKKGKKKGKKRKKISRKGSYPSDSSTSSSSASSSSSSDSESEDSGVSDSSDDSTIDARQSSKARKKAKRKAKKPKRTQKKRRKKKDRRNIAIGVDPSTADKTKVFGFSITGKELDEAIAPIGFPKKEREVLFEAAVDTASLPGMYLSKQMLDVMGNQDDLTADRATDMAATMLTAGLGRKSNFRDTMWRQPKRHGLRGLKDRTSFFTLAAAINKAKEPAFDQQDNHVRSLMTSHGYDEAGIDDYLQRGLLGRITRDTFRFYQDLMNAAREAHLDPNTGGDRKWEGGRGEALINHHAQKLLDTRTFAPDRRSLILRTYTYLRDAAKASFNTPEMGTAMWDQLAQVQSRMANLATDAASGKKGGVKPPPTAAGDSNKCGHCRCTGLHRLLNIGTGKRQCPFTRQTFANAKLLGTAANEKLRLDPTLDPQSVVNQVIRESNP